MNCIELKCKVPVVGNCHRQSPVGSNFFCAPEKCTVRIGGWEKWLTMGSVQFAVSILSLAVLLSVYCHCHPTVSVSLLSLSVYCHCQSTVNVCVLSVSVYCQCQCQCQQQNTASALSKLWPPSEICAVRKWDFQS